MEVGHSESRGSETDRGKVSGRLCEAEKVLEFACPGVICDCEHSGRRMGCGAERPVRAPVATLVPQDGHLRPTATFDLDKSRAPYQE